MNRSPSPHLPVLGIDPGRDGGAVLLDDDGTVIEAWGWTHRTRGGGDVWELQARHGLPVEIPDAHDHGLVAIGEAIGAEAPAAYVLVVEGLFGHGPTLERLAWFAGLVTAPLLGRAIEVHRPKCQTWRPMMLGIPGNTKAAAAEAYAVRLVSAGAMCIGTLGGLARKGHTAEACCLAAYGLRMQSEQSQRRAHAR